VVFAAAAFREETALSELTQTLAADKHTTLRHKGGRGPTFPELIYAHYAWWRELHGGKLTEPTKSHYERLKGQFEDAHGEIVRAYWCSNVESAVVLTERPRRFSWLEPRIGFYRESEWATRQWPDVATELHRCDELAVRATTVLSGVRRTICMHLVMASAEHLLGLADRRAAPATAATDAPLLNQEREALARAEAYYKEAANGQAQIVYFSGMAAVLLVVAAFATVWLAISWALPVAAMLAGAIGAVVSVVARINSGQFTLDYDVGRPYAFFLGGLRPLIGAAFAMAITFAFDGGLLHVPVAQGEKENDRRLALLVIAFLAGFSERWAQDTLVAAVPGMAKKEPPPAPPPAPASAPPADTTAAPPAADGAGAPPF
jgi:hypothetical protein